MTEATTAAAIGVDVRDAAIVTVVAGRDGTVLARDHRDETAPQAAVDAINRVGGHFSRTPDSDTAGTLPIGVSVRNPLDPHAAAIVNALSAAAPSRQVRLLTRGAAMAVGEQWCGAAKGVRYVVALTLDDCVHAGIAVDGRPFEGAHGLAGAAGWLSLNPVDREDYRKLGCLEAEVGLAGIARRLVWRLKAGDRSRVLEAAGGDLNAITARHVFEGARAGDGVAISVVRDTARYIGMAVANLAVILDPEAIVLGGAIGDASDLFLEAAHAEVVRRLPPPVWESLTFTIAALGEDAAPLGAAQAALLHA